MEACCHPQRDGIRMWTENLKITRIVSKTKENRLLNRVSANMTISCSHRERVAPLASQPVSLNMYTGRRFVDLTVNSIVYSEKNVLILLTFIP